MIIRLLETVLGALKQRSRPTLESELQSLMETHSRWEGVSLHRDTWIELPGKKANGLHERVRVRPNEAEAALLFSFGDGDEGRTVEVDFPDLRRLLICAQEQWGYR
jgi:hypothetical protein